MDPSASLWGGPPRSIYYDPVEHATGDDDGQLSKLNHLLTGSAPGTLLSCVASARTGWDLDVHIGRLFLVLTGLSAVYAACTLWGSADIAPKSSINVRLVAMTLASATMVSMAITYLVRRSAALIVYSSAASVPMGLVAGGCYTLGLYSRTFNGYLLLPGVAMLLAGSYMLSRLACARHREAMASTVAVMNAACDTICGAKDVYLVSGLFAVALSGYFYIWMQTVWRMPKTTVNVVGAAVMLLWTQGVLETMHRAVIGSITAASYFDDNDDNDNDERYAKRSAFAMLLDTSMQRFGQVCMVGLFRLWWRVMRMGVGGCRRAVKWIPGDIVRVLCTTPTLGLAGVVEAWSCKLSDHALYYAGINPGVGLLQSARAIVRIFRRNLIMSLLTDTPSTLLVVLLPNLSIVAMGCLVALHLHDLPTACACGLLGYGTTAFFSSILVAAVDASLVCYAVDLDGSKLHRPRLHQAFSSRLSAIRQSNAQ